MERKELNYLFKHMKKKQPSSHSFNELSKTQFFPMSIVNYVVTKLDITWDK